MRVMVAIKASPESEAGEMPSEELLSQMGAFNQALSDAGIMKAGEGLKPTSEAKRMFFNGTAREVADGPFVETKELIAGFWLWQVDSMEDAIDWAKRIPFQGGSIDIRPIFEMEDFGEELTPELQKQEETLRRRSEMSDAFTQPYLFFNGRCEEALEFYSRELGAIVLSTMRWNQNTEACSGGTIPPEFQDKIMHAEFKIGSQKHMASDGNGETETFGGFRLALHVPTLEECDRVFSALAEGGQVDVPLSETFFSPRFGMVTDRFGLGWIVLVPSPEEK